MPRAREGSGRRPGHHRPGRLVHPRRRRLHQPADAGGGGEDVPGGQGDDGQVCALSLRGLAAFGKFWYGFIIGDDWTVAAAVAAALAVTWLLHAAGVTAWWLPPLAAVAATGASLRRIRK